MSDSKDRWEFYRDAKQKWRWRRLSKNGRIVDASTQGYRDRSTCLANAKRCGFDPQTAAA